MKLTPKNWSSFQHYKQRTPPWIKLHRTLLDDYEFIMLPVASRALAPLLWLLASEYHNGIIDGPPEKIAFRVHMSVGELQEALKPLIDAGFFTLASGMLAPCKQEVHLETEGETERETEKRADARGDEMSKAEPPSLESPAAGQPKKYAYEGSVIRLTQVHFDQWCRAYPQLDMLAELTARDAWLSTAPPRDRSNWFVSTSKYLANRNMEAKAKANPQKTRYPDPHDWRNAL